MVHDQHYPVDFEALAQIANQFAKTMRRILARAKEWIDQLLQPIRAAIAEFKHHRAWIRALQVEQRAALNIYRTLVMGTPAFAPAHSHRPVGRSFEYEGDSPGRAVPSKSFALRVLRLFNDPAPLAPD